MKLKIQKFGLSGLEQAVECLGGQVSVFRAYDKSAIDSYAQALFSPSEYRSQFRIEVDGQSVRSEEVYKIGFNLDETSGSISCIEHLTSIGISTKEAFYAFSNHRLVELSQSTLQELSAAQRNALEMIRAVLSRQRLIVLKDPFVDFSDELREHFAILLCDYARQSESIIVVTKLSRRPESWIDNIDVSRIVIDNEVESTIGPGSSVQALLRQVREGKEQKSKSAKTRHLFWNSNLERIALNAGFSVFSFLLVGLLFFISSSGGQIRTQSAQKNSDTVIPSVSLNTTGNTEQTRESTSNQGKLAIKNVRKENNSADFGIHEPHVLARYPEPIESSIRLAFEGQLATTELRRENAESTSSTPLSSEPDSNRDMKKKTSDLLLMLQNASGKEEQAKNNYVAPELPSTIEPESQSPDSFNPMEWEQRREQMRQRFLEAISQANNS